MYIFVTEDHMLDWYSCKKCYPLETKLLLLLLLYRSAHKLFSAHVLLNLLLINEFGKI